MPEAERATIPLAAPAETVPAAPQAPEAPRQTPKAPAAPSAGEQEPAAMPRDDDTRPDGATG